MKIHLFNAFWHRLRIGFVVALLLPTIASIQRPLITSAAIINPTRLVPLTDSQFRSSLKGLLFATESAQADAAIAADSSKGGIAIRELLAKLHLQRRSQLNEDVLYYENKKTGAVTLVPQSASFRQGTSVRVKPLSGLQPPVYWDVWNYGVFSAGTPAANLQMQTRTTANCTLDWLGDWCDTANWGLLSNGATAKNYWFGWSGIQWGKAVATTQQSVLVAGSPLITYFGGAYWDSTQVLVVGTWTIEMPAPAYN